jgi:2,4-dienoyl-CoA reductase-like NADH-dependent reductase (Old Yellow Enzyme family)
MSDLKLLTKITMGDLELQNRLVLAPLTRARYVFNQPASNDVPIHPLID